MEKRNARLARLTQLYAALNECNRAVLGSTTEAELFPRICAAAVKAGQLQMSWIGVLDASSGDVRPVAAFGSGSDYIDGLRVSTTLGSPLSLGPTGTAIRNGLPVWCQDFQSDPRTAPWHERARQFGWRASAALPLLRNGKPYASLALYADSVDAFDAPAQELLAEMGHIISSAIDRFEIEAEKGRAHAELERYAQRLHELTLGTVALASALGDARDPYTAGHERRVAAIAAAIAKELRLDPAQVEGLWVAGMLHDIGKIGVPIEILVSPAKLSANQFELIKTHAAIGYEILRKVDFPWPLAEIVLQHHERLDGGGYPRGLFAKDISLEARIIAVADVVEAMSSHRPYRPSLGVAAALEEIERGSGTAYDSQVGDACLRLFRELEFVIPQ